MGWGRYSTQDIQRLMLISLVALVIGIGLPTCRAILRKIEAAGITLSWYHYAGVYVGVPALIIAAIAIVCAVAGLVLSLAIRHDLIERHALPDLASA